MDTEHPAWFPLPTKAVTAWTFESARPANGKENLALLWPRYGLDLDEQNTTQGGNTYRFDLVFASQGDATADIDGIEVEASADDGATWQPATVERKGDGSCKVSVSNPATGHVSLRVMAQDTNGSKIEQTLIKAYAGDCPDERGRAIEVAPEGEPGGVSGPGGIRADGVRGRR